MLLNTLDFWEVHHVMEYFNCTASVAYKMMAKVDRYNLGKVRVKRIDLLSAIEATKIPGKLTIQSQASTFAYKRKTA